MDEDNVFPDLKAFLTTLLDAEEQD